MPDIILECTAFAKGSKIAAIYPCAVKYLGVELFHALKRSTTTVCCECIILRPSFLSDFSVWKRKIVYKLFPALFLEYVYIQRKFLVIAVATTELNFLFLQFSSRWLHQKNKASLISLPHVQIEYLYQTWNRSCWFIRTFLL